jgi:hypothetical protein
VRVLADVDAGRPPRPQRIPGPPGGSGKAERERERHVGRRRPRLREGKRKQGRCCFRGGPSAAPLPTPATHGLASSSCAHAPGRRADAVKPRVLLARAAPLSHAPSDPPAGISGQIDRRIGAPTTREWTSGRCSLLDCCHMAYASMGHVRRGACMYRLTYHYQAVRAVVYDSTSNGAPRVARSSCHVTSPAGLARPFLHGRATAGWLATRVLFSTGLAHVMCRPGSRPEELP